MTAAPPVSSVGDGSRSATAPKHALHLCHRPVELPGDIVFPDPQYSPTELLQIGIGSPIALDVAIKLHLPETSIRGRTRVVLGAAVPEAPVDEDRHPLAYERQVRATGQLLPERVSPASPVQGPPERELGARIATPNSGHLLRLGEWPALPHGSITPHAFFRSRRSSRTSTRKHVVVWPVAAAPNLRSSNLSDGYTRKHVGDLNALACTSNW